MQTHFICKDGQTYPIQKCYEACRLKDRCAPMSYLKFSGDVRKWKGIPSVTQLINGTRESYLKITHDFAESPASNTYAITGTKGHAVLEKFGINAEEGISFEGISGIPDDYEPETKSIIDYKFSGSYKVALVLGIKMEEHGTGEYYKNGKEKVRKVPVYGKRDFGDWGKQVNMYRIILKRSKNIDTERQKLFLVPRDGGTYISDSRGVTENMYYIDIPFEDDDKILSYFIEKRDLLLNHLESKTMPELCSSEETWAGKKCQKFCSVSLLCPDNPYLSGE